MSSISRDGRLQKIKKPLYICIQKPVFYFKVAEHAGKPCNTGRRFRGLCNGRMDKQYQISERVEFVVKGRGLGVIRDLFHGCNIMIEPGDN
jgi:hypothetical protein